MSDEITHTCTMTIPGRYWPIAKGALRALRMLHQKGGGTSTLRRKGDTVTLTASGPTQSVLDAIANAKKIKDKVQEQVTERTQTYESMYDKLQSRVGEIRRKRGAAFLADIADELQKRGK